MSQWIVENDLLLFENNGERNCLSAREITLLNEGENPGPMNLPIETVPPLEALKDIRFSSKIRASASIVLDFDESSQSIVFMVQVSRLGKKYTCKSYNGLFPDHMICGKAWTYISNMSEIDSLLSKEAITDRVITLNQYIGIKYQASKYEIIIEDYAQSKVSNHPLTNDTSKPALLKAKLYPYQEVGYRWLRFMTDEGCGCILGDEMGLGKTLQIISLIAARCRKVKKPSLIIAPVSLLENWKREFRKFTEGIRVHVSYKRDRISYYKDVKDYDVIITAYSTAISDFAMISMADWDLIVLDEAQNIKNPDALRTKTIKKFNCNIRIAVTGTPFENHITDLWSLTDFIVPGLLGPLNQFKQEFEDDSNGAKKIEPIISPLLLRRKVSEVGDDLPERTDIPEALTMDEIEAEKYESIRRELIQELGPKKATLPLLQKLRMYCTHPSLLNKEIPSHPEKTSQKYQRLLDILDESVIYQRKVIIFTSYNHMFEIFESDIQKKYEIRRLQ